MLLNGAQAVLKALEHDQRQRLEEDAAALGLPGARIRAAIYDGDTPTAQRRKLRDDPPNVLITTPDLYPHICEAVIDKFDKTIPQFYDEEDRQRGHIVGENRQGQEVKFPLASISIAVVTNVKRKFKNHIQFGEVAAEMKEHVKTISGSTYMVDKRGDDKTKGRKDRKLINLPDRKHG